MQGKEERKHHNEAAEANEKDKFHMNIFQTLPKKYFSKE